MFSISSVNRSISSNQLSILVKTIIRYAAQQSSSGKLDEDIDNRERLETTKKMRLLGLQSNQARKALAIYNDYIYRQKKSPDLRMFAVAINCAMIAEDLQKGREIHQFIEQNFPHFKDNLMLKQQLRYLYIKCNDQISANKLFQQSSTVQHTKKEIQQNQKSLSFNSNQSDKIKIK